MRESIREKRQLVDQSLKTRGLIPRVEKVWASEAAQNILTEEFEGNLQALREKVKSLPECYALCVKLAYDGKCSEKAEYSDTVEAIFRFKLDECVNNLAGFMKVDGVLQVLADESQNGDLWLESLRSACKTVSGFVMDDFCEKVLTIGMPASKTKNDLKMLILVMTGEMVDDDVINHLWLQHVVICGMTGVLR